MEGGEIEDNPLKVMELTEAELATGLSWTSQHSPSELGSNPHSATYCSHGCWKPLKLPEPLPCSPSKLENESFHLTALLWGLNKGIDIMDFAQPLTCSKHLNAEHFTRAGCRGRCWSRVTLLVFRSASWQPWFRPLTVHLAHRSFKIKRMFLTIHVLVIRVWPSWEGEATSASSLSFVTSPARFRL